MISVAYTFVSEVGIQFNGMGPTYINCLTTLSLGKKNKSKLCPLIRDIQNKLFSIDEIHCL